MAPRQVRQFAPPAMPTGAEESYQRSGDVLDKAVVARQPVVVVHRFTGETVPMSRYEAERLDKTTYGFVDADSTENPLNPTGQSVRVVNSRGSFDVPYSVAALMDPNRNQLYALDDKGSLVMEPSGQRKMVFVPTVSNDASDIRNQRVDDVMRPRMMQYSEEQQRKRAKMLVGEAAQLASMFIPVAGEGSAAAVLPRWLQALVPAASRTLTGAAVGAGVDAGTDFYYGAPVDPNSVLNSAVSYAGSNLVGEAVQPGLDMAAKASMKRALRPTAAMMERNPTLVDDALKIRQPVGEPGAKTPRATGARRAASRELGDMLRRGEQAGITIDYDTMSGRLRRLFEEVSAGDDTGEATAALANYIQSFEARYGGGAPIMRAQQLKRQTQSRARRVFDNERRGGSPTDIENVTARGRAAVAQDLRQGINDLLEAEGITSSAGLNANAVNEQIRRARAVEQATQRAQNLSPSRLENNMALVGGGVVGNRAAAGNPVATIGTGLAFQTFNTPQVMSRAALLFSDPRFQRIARYAPGFMAPPVAEATYRPGYPNY